jgi:ABC-type lipoprotein release transport system permease subunit
MQIGSYANMIDNAVKFSTGYIQIHKKGYWENKSINETFEYKDEIKELISSMSNVTHQLPRLESFALASSGNKTKGSIVIGTDPQLENELNHYKDRIISGEYLDEDDEAVLISEKLAEYLNVQVSDTVVMLGQGFHGITAANQYPVKGIIRFPLPQLNNQLIIMSLSACQYFYAADNRLTSISLMLADPEYLDNNVSQLESNLTDYYNVMSWDEMNKEMVQTIESDNIGGIIMLAILYIVIGFGVFGTIMMMTMERRKEFAVMVSIGMRKSKLLLMVLSETVSIGFVAILIGIVASYPLLLYLSHNPIPLTGELAESMQTFGVEPILPFSVKSSIFWNQTLTVIAISVVAILYPLSVILRLDIMKAMRS